MITIKQGQKVHFNYKNHRGDVARRSAVVRGVDYGETEWYPKKQWFLRCYDLDRLAERSFAVANIDMESFEMVGWPST